MEIDWNYKEEDWVFERSSGYSGERNIFTHEWLSSDEIYQKKLILQEYQIFLELNNFFARPKSCDEYNKLVFESFKRNGFSIFKLDK